MQQGNDYMDELFRKAADHYPLNTKSSDWEQFNKKLDKDSISFPAKSPNQKIYEQAKRWTAAAVLVLIPLAIAVIKPYGPGQQVNGFPAKSNASVSHNAIDISGKPVTAILTGLSTSNSFYISKPKNNLTEPGKETGHLIVKSVPQTYTEKLALESIAKLENNITENSTATEQITSNQPGEMKKVPAPVAKEEQPNSATAKKSRFYLGAVVAPEYTRVKLQQFSKPGINFGVVTGFQVNKNLSLELGILLAKKYYYSDGKYLPKNSLGRDGSDIISLEAYNSITEIPFVVKYNFKQERKGDFFASAGAVSYVMHKELYNYSYDANGQQKEGVKYVNKAANYYFSNIQLSVGYERQVSKNGMLRVEPYYRIPISGIGISDLPVTSIGLNIALTTRLK